MNAKKKLFGGLPSQSYGRPSTEAQAKVYGVTKWANYSCRRDNPDEYAEIIAREFRHGLRVGVNTGTTGMLVGFSIEKDDNKGC